MNSNQIVIIGAGAAGVFAAVNTALLNPKKKVIILEKTSKLLAKVKISGGGRCNVTNVCSAPYELVKNYPRGHNKLLHAFKSFGTTDTIEWFENKGVKLKTEPDGRIFPITDNSQTIIDCLLNTCQKHDVEIKLSEGVKKIEKVNGQFIISTSSGQTLPAEKVLVATGGSPKIEGYDWLASLGHEISEPVPSLFTFNLKNKSITELSGLAVAQVNVKIAGTKLAHDGPLLITHWGFSGPAVLKLSAWAARILHEKNYVYGIVVNWLGAHNEDNARTFLAEYALANPLKKVAAHTPFPLPKRLWEFLIQKAEIDKDTRWNNFSGKKYNRLINNLVADQYEAEGKTTFKEEFVTAGGVKLSQINLETMESKKISGLYFAGEVLDIDGVTGGFNFQAAWTTAWLAAKAMAE